MLRLFTRAAISAQSTLRQTITHNIMKPSTISVNLTQKLQPHRFFGGFQPILQQTPAAVPVICGQQQNRTVTKFSMRSGKRKSIKAVIKRFYRLNWGGWIRTRTGRHKKMWRKTASNKYRLRQHVLMSGTQSWFLDKCVTKYWRKPKHYVDDLYQPYHTRDEHFATKNTKIYY